MEGFINEIMNDDNDGLIQVEQFLNQIFNHMNIRTLNPSLIDNVMDQSFREQKVKQYASSEEFIQGLEKVVIKEGDEYSCGICLEEFKVGETVLKLPCKDTPHFFHYKEDKDKEDEKVDEECSGILPWLKIKNSCPICRCEFPKGDEVCIEANNDENNDENNENETTNSIFDNIVILPRVNETLPSQANNDENTESDNNDNDERTERTERRPQLIEINLSHMFQQSMNTILEEREERMMQEVLYQSLQESSHDQGSSNNNDTSEP